MIAGANPGPALPTLCCQSMRGLTVATSSGNGPGLWLPPVSHANEGTGIDVIHDVSGDCDRLAHPAPIAAASSAHATLRSVRVISPLRDLPASLYSPPRRVPHSARRRLP